MSKMIALTATILMLALAACVADVSSTSTRSQELTDVDQPWQANCDPTAPPGDPNGCGSSPGGGGDACGSCTTTIGCIRSCGGDYACVDVGAGKQCVFSTPP